MNDTAVPWKESRLKSTKGYDLCYPVVNSAALTVDWQTLPPFSYMSIALMACSVDSCKTLSYDTDISFSKRMSMRSRLRVLAAHPNKHQVKRDTMV